MTAEAGENADAKILDERVVWSNAVSAQANATTLLTARVGDAETNIFSEQQARIDGDEAIASDLELLFVKTPDGLAVVLRKDVVQIGDGVTLASSLDSLSAAAASNEASITTLANTVATANSALSSQITSVSTTVGNHTASINSHTSSINGISVQQTIALDNNGYVTGTRQINGGPGQSSFTILTDNLVVAAPGMTPRKMLIWSGGVLRLSSVVVDTIETGVITANHIVGGAVTAASATEGNPGLGGTQNFGFSSTGGKHVINASCTVSQTGSGVSGVQAILYRNGSEISRGAVAFAGPFSSTIPLLALDQPGAGSHNYSVVCNTTGGSTGTNAVSSIKIVVTELKR
jgi:hypothetical protein